MKEPRDYNEKEKEGVGCCWSIKSSLESDIGIETGNLGKISREHVRHRGIQRDPR